MDLQHYKDKLIKLREETVDRLNKMDVYDVKIGQRDAIGELSLYDNHPADIGTETYEQEKNYALVDHEHHILRRIDDALKRIDNGTYGKCTHCGRQIEEERLEAVPYASLCLNCEKQNEMHLDDLNLASRPSEEQAISPSYGFNDNSKRDKAEFDAEDSWQAVARFSLPDNDPSFGTGDYMGDYTSDNLDDFDDEERGVVEPVEKISNEEYLATLPHGDVDDTEEDADDIIGEYNQDKDD